MLRSLVRASSFLGKEIAEVLRQPRLILALVLGPFLILFIFGLGYQNTARPVRTLFVADPASPLGASIKDYAPTVSPQLIFSGVTGDEKSALAQLRAGTVDLVAVAPVNAYDTIRSNQQAIFTLYHNEIDPAQSSYIKYLGNVYVDEVNRRVLSSMAKQGQSEASDVQKQVQEAKGNTEAMRSALKSGDVQNARVAQQKLNGNVSGLALAVGASAGLLSGVQQNVGGSDTSNQDILSTLSDLQANTSANNQIQDNQANYDAEIQRLDKTDADLTKLNTQLSEFQRISPDILVRPFGADTKTIAQLTVSQVDFFTPSVIVLLLQHIAVTIAALSIVRERRSGTLELFRVAPVSSLEAMLGKYVSYMIFGGVIACILTALIFFGLHVPMLGNWANFAAVAALLLFASIGLGFVISLLADTESQAVQLAMIALLVSVFFSGFLLDLRYFYDPVKVLSYAIPATYGIVLLQNVMLRGTGIPLIYLVGLAAYGVVMFGLAWFLMRRLMARR